jgi:hypothetical protein
MCNHTHLFFLGLGLGVVPDLKLFLALRWIVLMYLILPEPVPRLLWTLVPHPTSTYMSHVHTFSQSGSRVPAASACRLLDMVSDLAAANAEHVGSLMAFTQTWSSSSLRCCELFTIVLKKNQKRFKYCPFIQFIPLSDVTIPVPLRKMPRMHATASNHQVLPA